MNTIHANFFTGENKYKTEDNKILRNVLHKDYAKFLYMNNLPRAYDKADLESAARGYIGPQSMADRAASDIRDRYVSFTISHIKANGGYPEGRDLDAEWVEFSGLAVPA